MGPTRIANVGGESRSQRLYLLRNQPLLGLLLLSFADSEVARLPTVPFDKLTALMSAAAVEEKRSAGLLIESEKASASLSRRRYRRRLRSRKPERGDT